MKFGHEGLYILYFIWSKDIYFILFIALKTMSTPISSSSSENKEMSWLSDKAILRHMELGNIVIYPFTKKNLNTCSYDVTLGKHYFREAEVLDGNTIYNPYSKSSVEKVWGKPLVAENAGEWMKKSGQKLEGISDNDQIIWIRPKETILGHTNEFIGGKHFIGSKMFCRSSWGRSFIEVCKCASLGNINFTNRWVVELTNNSRTHAVPLPVGWRLPQIGFFATEGILTVEEGGQGSYTGTHSKYQISDELKTSIETWSPDDMPPKLYQDREITEGAAQDAVEMWFESLKI